MFRPNRSGESIKTFLKYALLENSLKLFPNRKLFCPLPFKHLEIMPSGKTLFCCYLNKSPGKVEGNNLAEVYNSKSAQEIRASILDGTFRYCNLEACPHFSSGNLPLQKDCVGTQFEAIIKDRLTVLDDMKLWLSFDQRCNLRCISCRDKPFQYTNEENIRISDLFKIVQSHLPKITRIGLSGSGDPFASAPTREFLFQLNAADFPGLKISLLTNGILLSETMWKTMANAAPAIHSVQISIDAASQNTYEGIRRGGSFEKLMENLVFLSGLRKSNALSEFIISFVVNSVNYLEMREFVELGKRLGCDQVYFSCIMHWGALSKAEYSELAIHRPTHQMHQAFLKELENPVFNDPIVLLGNLGRFKSRKILRDSLFS